MSDVDENETWHLTVSWKTDSVRLIVLQQYGKKLDIYYLANCIEEAFITLIWIKRTNLVDFRGSVTDFKFAPKTLRLLIATCSSDGVIRIYEAPDAMNLSQWTLQHDISSKYIIQRRKPVTGCIGSAQACADMII